MSAIYLVAGIIFLGVSIWLFFALQTSRRREKELTAQAEQIAADRAVEKQRADNLAEALHGKDIELIRAQAEVDNLHKQAEKSKKELEELQASFRLEFKNLANDILEEKSRQFKQTNKESIDQLLNPFKDSILEFKHRVEHIYSNENEQRGVLKTEIKNLLELNKRITEETNNLTNALKGNSKVQGDWGEMILDSILENSNLRKGIHYTTQSNFKDDSGNNLRPDVVLTLPEGKQIVIDSKVSLTAFANCAGADTAEERDRFMKDHIRSVRAHVEELGRKSYQTLVNSPDFVIMFVPTEPAFLAALQYDNSIWNDAYKKKVIISSPTNLFALLKIVDDLWKRNDQSKNAIAIAEEGAKLYDKFVGFVDTLEVIGKNIASAQISYDKAMGQLKTGSGNIIGRTEKLRKLGVKTSKTLPASILNEVDDAEIDDLSSAQDLSVAGSDKE